MIYDLLNGIQNNINRKMQPIIRKTKRFYDENSLTDEEFETFKQIEILDRSLQLGDIEKYQYFEDDTRKRKLKFIALLKNINRNHLQKNEEDKYVYKFINELFVSKQRVYSKIEEIKKFQNNFKAIKNYVDIREEYKEMLDSELHLNQVIPFLYLIYRDDFSDTESFRVIFSILFYDRKRQRSFDANLERIEKAVENNLAFEMNYDFWINCYL